MDKIKWKCDSQVFKADNQDLGVISRMKGGPVTVGQVSKRSQAIAANKANNIIDKMINYVQAQD